MSSTVDHRAVVRVTVTRGLCIQGQPHAAGTELALPAVEAGHLLMSGRCELADPGQRGAVNEALAHEASRFVSRQRDSMLGTIAGGPWRPLNQ